MGDSDPGPDAGRSSPDGDGIDIDLVAQFAGADEVVVSTGMNSELVHTTDRVRIATLLEIMPELTDGWLQPASGVPITRLRLNVRRDSAPLGSIGIGRTILTCHAHGTFFVRPGNDDTARRLLRAVGAGHHLRDL